MINIKVTELRLGNYVLVNGKIKTVLQLQLKPEIIHVNSHLCNFATVIKECQGLPITEELLKSFGLKKSQYLNDCSYYEWSIGDFFILQYPDRFEIYMPQYRIDFVHQLQNYYHSVKGKELTIS